MIKNLSIFILIVGIVIQLIGCSSSKVATVTQLNQKEIKPSSIQVVTADCWEYRFTDTNYYFNNDTLYGTGLDIGENWIPFKGKIALSEIEEIEFYSFKDNWTYNLTITEFAQFEKDEEKPSAITVFKYDSTKFLFMKNNYSIEADTLYAAGQYLKSKTDEQADIIIAISNIASVQYNFADKIDLNVLYDPTLDSIITYKNPGTEVYIKLNSGKEYNGELLCVLDTIIIVSEKQRKNEGDSTFLVYSFYLIKNQDIKIVEFKEGNMALGGIIFGAMLGSGIGFAVSQGEEEKEEKSDESWGFDFKINFAPITGCCIGGLVGGMIGGIIGANIPDNEVVYKYADHAHFNFSRLKSNARYSDKQPIYLEKLKPF